MSRKWAVGDGLIRLIMYWPILERSRLAQCEALEKVSWAVGFACIPIFSRSERIARSTRGIREKRRKDT